MALGFCIPNQRQKYKSYCLDKEDKYETLFLRLDEKINHCERAILAKESKWQEEKVEKFQD